MGNAKEKFIELLKLINNCREKLVAVYNLFSASVAKSKEDSAKMHELYDEAVTNYDNLKAMDMGQIAKSKMAIKNTKNRNNEIILEFNDTYQEFMNALKECVPLRDKYKKETSMCFEAYQEMSGKTEVSESIAKGFKQQLKLIKAIFEKIKTLILEYKAEKEVVINRYNIFDEFSKKADKLANSLV